MAGQTPQAVHPMHPHAQALKNLDGSWKYTNALADQTSPYLLQHAHNPVDWHPWGPGAFDLARRTGKPIFLSVGYSTCYWCHVMERQVFENPELAAVLNERCVSVKVDREERPDVDDIYMSAVQMMTGRGGWPMSVFLTPPGAAGPDDPGLKPFWAATYIPPQSSHGVPGFGDVVRRISDTWQGERQKVIDHAQQVAGALQQYLASSEPGQELDESFVEAAANQLVKMYDAGHGGFGGAPKFPQPAILVFLMKVYRNNPQPELWQALAYTLERMARGGVYDQVAGGFHRYATDPQWLVPHFEKMLYDNAQLLEAYLTAQAVEADLKDHALYERVVRETCDYVLREMTDAGGAFWSAQDAEVDAREGGSYLWTPQQVQDAVGDQGLAGLALKMYGLDRGTNFQDPHHDDQPPSNVLYLPVRLDELAKEQGKTLDQIAEDRQQINHRLLAARDQRKQPGTDDKVIVSWNGLMIAAMARAGQLLNEPRYTQAAAKAAGFIFDKMRQTGPGDDSATPATRQRLFRTARNGQAKIGALLEDYAFFTHGLLELYRATGEARWLDAGREMTATAVTQFSAHKDRGGGYYDTLADQADLFVRTMSTYDGATPSGNSQMVHNLIDLYELTGRKQYLDRAAADLRAFSGALSRRGAAMVHMQHALLRLLEAAPRVSPSGGAEVHSGSAPQQQGTVSARVEPATVDLASGRGDVRVVLTIQRGYHLNAPGMAFAGLVPVSLELEGAPGLELEVDYPPGADRRYTGSGDGLAVYEGVVTLKAVILRQEKTPQPSRPRLVLRYQACTDTECLEPREMRLPVAIKP